MFTLTALLISLFLESFVVVSPALAASPAPAITVQGSINPVKLYFNDDTGYRDIEITPWSLENHALGGDYLYLVTSYNTHLCSNVESLFVPTSYTRLGGCKLRQSSAVTPSNLSPTVSSLWSRDYQGAFSGHLIPTTNNGMILYTINHGELLNNNYFSADPQKCVLAPDLGYGTFPCTPENNTKSYNAFVTLSSFTFDLPSYNSSSLFTDRGPIAWPANGYVENGHKATFLGILHPASIIRDGYLYVFYRDTSSGDEAAGRGAGLKVIRAPITPDGVHALGFMSYHNGSFTDSALPSGFTAANINAFFSQKGGRSSSLFTPTNNRDKLPDIYSFSAAKLKGTNWYLGVGQDLNSGIVLSLSQDLLHWGEPYLVPGTEFVYSDPVSGGTPNFIKQPFMYPRLMSADGDSNVSIDPSDFYLTGASTGANPFNPAYPARVVNRLHLKVDVSQLQDGKTGDLNTDGHVNIFDYNLVLAGFGTSYTIFDYNHVVANYGQ